MLRILFFRNADIGRFWNANVFELQIDPPENRDGDTDVWVDQNEKALRIDALKNASPPCPLDFAHPAMDKILVSIK